MVTMINSHTVSYTENMTEVIAELYVDEVTDLPTNEEGARIKYHQGTIAYVINDAKMYVMNSSGNWVKANAQ